MTNLTLLTEEQGQKTLKYGIYSSPVGELCAGYYATIYSVEHLNIEKIIDCFFVPENAGYMCDDEDILCFNNFINYNSNFEDKEYQITLYDFDQYGNFKDSDKADILLKKNRKDKSITPLMKERYVEILKRIDSNGIPINFEYFNDIFENKDKETYIVPFSKRDFVGYYIDFKWMFDENFHNVVNAEGNHLWNDTICLKKIEENLDKDTYFSLCNKLKTAEEN